METKAMQQEKSGITEGLRGSTRTFGSERISLLKTSSEDYCCSKRGNEIRILLSRVKK